MNYTFRIKWKTYSGHNYEVTADAYSKAEAMCLCIAEAKKYGWHQPRWYEFWRKNDTVIDLL